MNSLVMATIAALPGVHALIRKLIVEERRSHKYVSSELKRRYPMMQRGLGERSVRRFCNDYDIHTTSRVTDQALDVIVRSCVEKVRQLNI